MRDMNDYGPELGVEARRILREALQALEVHRASLLIGDPAYCLATDRVRRVASIPEAVTVHEQRHAFACARCGSRLRAFQGARMTTPERTLDGALQTARRSAGAIPQRWLAYADQHGRTLFDLFRREREFGDSPAAVWFPTPAVTQEIEAARNDGASAEITAYLVRTALGAVAAVTHDVLSPWSRDFDRAWPMFELLREAAREVLNGGAPAKDAFVHAYVGIAVGAPTHLKAILIDGIDSIAIGASGGHALASSLAAELRRADRSRETMSLLALPAILQVPVDEPEDIDELLRPYLIASRRASEQLRSAIDREDSADDLAALVHATLGALIDQLAADDDAIPTLLQLRVVRRYLAEIVSFRHSLDSVAGESVMDAVVGRLVAYARMPNVSSFVVLTVAQALAPEVTSYAGLLSVLATVQDAELQHAIIVALRHAYDGEAQAKDRGTPRFEQTGGTWSFVGTAAHPLDQTARELAESARTHPTLGASLAWFNRRPERSMDGDGERMFLPMSR
jgi:hypothetical protein